MHLLWIYVLGLMGLLGLAVLFVPAANRLNFPYTVLLVVVGCFLGYAEITRDNAATFGAFDDFLRALKHFKITSDAVFFIFLPALICESALTIDVRRLMDDVVPIMFLAVIGLLISTIVVAYPLALYSGVSIIVCLLLAAIVSATDPVAVVAIFKDVGAPKRLSILVEGESLLNDATAIVVFTILVSLLTESSEASFLNSLGAFIKIFFGGAIIGFICGRFVCWIFSLTKELPLVAITMTISSAYLTFIIAEHYSHVSGVMAVLSASLVIGSRGRTLLSPKSWDSLQNTWEQLGFWANSVIFILVGMTVPFIMADFKKHEWLLLIIILASAFFVRVFIIFILLPILSYFRICQKVNVAYKTVMVWGGLRGAVSLALALAVIENPQIDSEVRSFIGILATGFVLFTLFVNATTIRLVINFFSLGKLSPVDIAVRDRATAVSLDTISNNLIQIAKELEVEEQINELVIRRYQKNHSLTREELRNMSTISTAQWSTIGLTMLTAQERKAFTQQYAEGLLSSLIYRLLITLVDDIADALKQNGVLGYNEISAKCLNFDWRFHLAAKLQRQFNVTTPLSHRVSERFEVLLGSKIALGRVIKNGLPSVMQMIGEKAGNDLITIIHLRYDQTNSALEALKLQYPNYAKKLEQLYLEHSAMRLEQSEYQAMLSNALINNDVYLDLNENIEQRLRTVARIPKLDLGLDPEKLLIKVPLFENLPPHILKQLAAMLKPKLVVPGETIIKKGSHGDDMYFISSGVILVSVKDNEFMRGSGDFFGEIALLTDHPRTADVVAKGYCKLLTLNRSDFKKFLTLHPHLQNIIKDVAQERLKADNITTNISNIDDSQ